MTDARPTHEEMIQFIRSHGWREDRRTSSAWRFYEPRFPLAKYKLKDAWELEKGRQS